MKFIVKNHSGKNIINLMRQINYFFLKKEGEELSFVRPLERSGYPRLHIYAEIDEKNSKIIFNLHLDQKKPIYREATAHSGEYDSELVKEEAGRIKQILQK